MGTLIRLAGATGASAPAPPSVPSLANERAYYSARGYTYASSVDPDNIASLTDGDPTYTISPSLDVHNDTENDDLWMHLVLYEMRPNCTTYKDRRDAWLNWFLNTWLTSTTFDADAGQLHDHIYGEGLIRYYQNTGDASALSIIQEVGAIIESRLDHWTSGPSWVSATNRWTGGVPIVNGNSIAYYNGRFWMRATRFICDLARAVPTTQWTTLRDRIADITEASPDWDPRGFHHWGDWQTNNQMGLPNGSWEAGYTVSNTWIHASLGIAYYRLWEETGRTIFRDRCIQQARWIVNVWRHTPYGSEVYGTNGIGYGPTGKWQPSYTPTAFYAGYTPAMAGLMCLGYKLTGNRHFLNEARFCYWRGSQIDGEQIDITNPATRAAAGTIEHFMDTMFASATGYKFFDLNKGMSPYWVWKLWENGAADPTIESPTTLMTRASLISQGNAYNWATESGLSGDTDFFQAQAGSGSGTALGSILAWSQYAYWNPIKREVNFIGQAHNANRIAVRYIESSNTWSRIDADPVGWEDGDSNIGHAYEHNMLDWYDGNMYFSKRGSHATYQRWRVSDAAFDLDHTTFTATSETSAQTANEFFPGRANWRFGIRISDGGIYRWNYSGGTGSGNWTQVWTPAALAALSQPYAPSTDGYMWARYSPHYDCIFFGGSVSSGSPAYSRMYKLHRDMTITVCTAINDTVGAGGLGAGTWTDSWSSVRGAYVIVEPQFGNLLVISDLPGQVFEYLVQSDSWRRRTDAETVLIGSGKPLTDASGAGYGYTYETMHCSLWEHGLIAFLIGRATVTNSQVWLYRHKENP